ncbi:MAG: hypothetical protein ACRDFS_07370 [Chloroflexota bacterium]
MTDDHDHEEVRFLKEKAMQLRTLARKLRFPPNHELFVIADDFEHYAGDLEHERQRFRFHA